MNCEHVLAILSRIGSLENIRIIRGMMIIIMIDHHIIDVRILTNVNTTMMSGYQIMRHGPKNGACRLPNVGQIYLLNIAVTRLQILVPIGILRLRLNGTRHKLVAHITV